MFTAVFKIRIKIGLNVTPEKTYIYIYILNMQQIKCTLLSTLTRVPREMFAIRYHYSDKSLKGTVVNRTYQF